VETTGLAALDRLYAGGRHVRMLVLGEMPVRAVMPARDKLALLARVGAESLVADPCRLPFVEAMFDRALVASDLAKPREELRELWRVLTPAGLAVLLVPGRRGWPGRRRGWDRGRLEPYLAGCMFEILDWETARLPERTGVVLIGKVDGVRPSLVGLAETALRPAGALQRERAKTACSASKLDSKAPRGWPPAR